MPSPQRVMMVLICEAVKFWHSSSKTNAFWIERPRIKLIDLNWMLALSQMYFIEPSVQWSFLCSASKVSVTAANHGIIFSSSEPGKKPIDSPISGVFRVTIILSNMPFSMVCSSAAAIARSVLPLPAAPVRITKSISGSSKASIAMPW